jgi:hypothetical protein
MTGDRAASEVVGFLLVFVVVLAGVGAVSAAGFDTLSAIGDHQRTASAERAFLVVSEGVEEAATGSVRRSATLALAEGRLRVGAGPRISPPGGDALGTGTLSYRTGATRLSYASGGVLRADGRNATVLRAPAVSCPADADVAVVSVVAFRANRTVLGTDGRVTVEVTPRSTSVWAGERVHANVSGATHAAAWAGHLAAAGWNRTAPAVYTCEAERVVVRRTVLDLQFVA